MTVICLTLIDHFCLTSLSCDSCLTTPSGPQMPTSVTIKHLLKDISALSNTLLDAVPKGSKDNKIWSVLNTKEGDIPHETFNHRFDALFGEDCHDSGGRLLHV